MQDFKNKLYHFETQPPEELWDEISERLDNKKILKVADYRKPRIWLYSATAAAAIVILFVGSYFFKNKKQSVPEENTTTINSKTMSPGQIKDSINLNQKILKSIIDNPEENLASNNSKINSATKKYLTVAGPEGRPVKISPKVATLIISADNEFPPKPVWSKKINKWQKIMLSSTASPTSANLVDLMQADNNNGHFE